jgi:hypothetical protein
VGTAGVWTGDQLLIWGGTPGTYNNFFADGAAYDPATDRWHRLAPSSGRFASGAVWTGTEMLVWGGIVPLPGAGRMTEIESPSDGLRLTP